MADLRDILENYYTLRDYCDAFWKSALAKLPGQFACGPGCSVCCELPSVNYLEAFVIAEYLETVPLESDSEGTCPFLANNRCQIYPARPLICRTHGLMLKSKEFTARVTITCPYNFPDVDLDTVDTSCALDIDKITDNSARLNMAFCMLRGDRAHADKRIAMIDLAQGTVTTKHLDSRRVGAP